MFSPIDVTLHFRKFIMKQHFELSNNVSRRSPILYSLYSHVCRKMTEESRVKLANWKVQKRMTHVWIRKSSRMTSKVNFFLKNRLVYNGIVCKYHPCQSSSSWHQWKSSAPFPPISPPIRIEHIFHIQFI